MIQRNLGWSPDRALTPAAGSHGGKGNRPVQREPRFFAFPLTRLGDAGLVGVVDEPY
ncbi:MAG: hypothetical protein K8R89_03955 [Anaerolineae bacterium]|nr:hypothetical protein [Anaerolineae bacterium]